MKSETTIQEPTPEPACADLQHEESMSPDSPSSLENSIRGPLQVLAVFLIIFNVW